MADQSSMLDDLDYLDKTQPSDDILKAIEQLKNVSGSPTPTQPNSQEQDAPPDAPQSEWEQLRAQLREKPVDADAWLRLVDLAEESGDIERIKDTYEGLLETYPNTSSVQLAYLGHFLNDPSQFSFAEALFKRFLLRTSPSVELLKSYLTYIRRVTTGPNAREVIRKCFDFALGHIGQDKSSYEIWQEYIHFLKAGETTTTWEEQQKMDAVRKAYHHAVQIPMDNVKKLWEEYQEFENGLNKITAKKFISDLQTGHMQARSVYNQLQEHLTVLFPPNPPSKSKVSLWLPRPPTFNAGDRALVGRWRMYLKWEEGNPLEIEEKDRATLLQRVQSIYKKAVVRMRYYSEIWFMAYSWMSSIGKTEEALTLLKSGIDANPSSFVLNFAYAEALEMKKEPEVYAEVHSTYEKFLDTLRKDLEALEVKANASNSQTNGQETEPSSQNTSFSAGSAEEKNPKLKELNDRRTDYGIAWIMYLRFVRRAEGQAASRKVFGKARRDRWTPWETWEAGALMEYHSNNKDSTVASRIFEKGMELFKDEVEFVLRYLGFLISINDENNARALFERVIGTFTPERARPLWERWARYEYQYGDLEAVQKLEKRMADAYPSDPPIKRFAERHKYHGTDSIAVRDLGFVVSRQGSNASVTRGGRANGNLERSDTQQSLNAGQSQQPLQPTASVKRASSPENRRHDDRPGDYGPPPKRQRGASPSRERERERWDGPPRGRRHGSPPGWDRERERDGRRAKDEKHDEKGVAIPPVISWFVGTLPPPAGFDGPVFRTEDLMQVFRNAVIPASAAGRPRSPVPPPRPAGGGRPPPDYGPYQGPGGGRRGRW